MLDEVREVDAGATVGAEAEASNCPSCRRKAHRVFYEAARVPANSCILFTSSQEARQCPTGRIRLVSCQSCGFIFNSEFDRAKTEYSGRYEETQGFSATFNRFHHSLAERLIDTYELRCKKIVEIGCGKGEFLFLLAELGANACIGIDPSVHIGRLSEPSKGSLRLLPEFYSERHAELEVDFLVCKMTLEHIPDVAAFVSTVRRGLDANLGATVFFQIPETMRILMDCAFEDIYHEHCSYFTPSSLARLFRRCGFDVLSLSTEYAGQYLTIEARPRPAGAAPMATLSAEDETSAVDALVASFPGRCAQKLAEWHRVLAEAHDAGRQVVIWGSGSKAVAFLSALDPEQRIACVTDVNPYRHNHYMPISAQRILAPSELAAIRPDLVIAMNGIYKDEIRRDLAALGLAPELRSL